MKRFSVLLILVIALIGIAIVYFRPLIFKKQIRENIPAAEAVPAPRAAAKGVIESIDKAEISSKVVGLIQKIMADENENVKKGQTLIILDSKEIEAQIKEAEASVKKAYANYEKDRIDYERHERLYKNHAVTLDKLEDAERHLKSSDAGLMEANARLEYARSLLKNFILKSPIDGVVIKKYLEVGEVAREGMPLLSVANMDNLKIRAELDETDVGKVYVGQGVEALADAYPGRVYYGKITKISEDVKRKVIKTYDPIAWMDINSQEITINLDSFEGLKIGMTVDVKFHTDDKAK